MRAGLVLAALRRCGSPASSCSRGQQRRAAQRRPRLGLIGSAAAAWAAGRAYPLGVVAVATVLAHGALIRWRWSARWPQRAALRAGAALGPLVAALVVWAREGSPVGFGLLALLTALVLSFTLVAPPSPQPSISGVSQVGRGISSAITVSVAAAVLLLVVVPLNLLSRLVGFSPLDPGGAPRSLGLGGGRSETSPTPRRPPRPSDRMAALEPSPSPAVRRRSTSGSWPRYSSPPSWWWHCRGRCRSPGSGSSEIESAAGTFARPFEDDPALEGVYLGGRDLRLDLLDAWTNLEFNAAVGGWQAGTSPRPTPPSRTGSGPPSIRTRRWVEPFDMWFFGGSAAFGAGRRDAHTIPSELVRQAGAEAVALEVHNLAVPATVNWQAAMLLLRGWWEDPPDLVVFYDGANDLALQDVLTGRGMGRSDRPAWLHRRTGRRGPEGEGRGEPGVAAGVLAPPKRWPSRTTLRRRRRPAGSSHPATGVGWGVPDLCDRAAGVAVLAAGAGGEATPLRGRP